VTPATLALAFLTAAAQPPEPVVTYAVVQSVRAATPRGSREQALAGAVAVSGERVRWELSGSTFPGTRTTLAVGDAGGVTLVDLREKLAAAATWDEFRRLFQQASSEAGPAAATLAASEASVTAEGPGPARDGIATSRYRVSFSWTMRLAQPGRLVTVAYAARGTVDAADGFRDGRSGFDDLLPLFVARGEAREKLTAELGKIGGLPVAVALETESEVKSEPAAAPGSAPAVPGPLPAPLRTTGSVTRTVSALARRAGTKGDAALFSVPDDVRSRSLDRLLLREASLP
jgi:hypothetical protein